MFIGGMYSSSRGNIYNKPGINASKLRLYLLSISSFNEMPDNHWTSKWCSFWNVKNFCFFHPKCSLNMYFHHTYNRVNSISKNTSYSNNLKPIQELGISGNEKCTTVTISHHKCCLSSISLNTKVTPWYRISSWLHSLTLVHPPTWLFPLYWQGPTTHHIKEQNVLCKVGILLGVLNHIGLQHMSSTLKLDARGGDCCQLEFLHVSNTPTEHLSTAKHWR